MRITERDLQSEARPGPRRASGESAARRRWSERLAALPWGAVFTAGMAAAFALGVLLSGPDGLGGVRDFVAVLIRRPRVAANSLWHAGDLPTLYVDIAFADHQRLVTQRNYAVQQGALTEGPQLAPATFTLGEDRVEVEVGLPLDVGDAFAGERWPLYVEFPAADAAGRALCACERALLLPADAQSRQHWGFLTTLKREGGATMPYRLLRVTVNGKSWGLFALAGLPPDAGDDAYVTFDARDFLATYAAAGRALADSGFAYAQVVASAEDADDRAQAAARMQKLYEGALPPAHVLDADAWGRYLALTTLWYGAPTRDWRTLLWRYRPADARFAPVGAGWMGAPTDFPLPDAFARDPNIQAAYLRAVKTYSDPAYLRRLQASLAPELDALCWATNIALDYPPLPWDDLAAHQAQMRALLHPRQPARVAVSESEGMLVVRVANLTAFPLEVTGLNVGESAWLALDRAEIIFAPVAERPLPDQPWIAAADRALLVDAPAALVLRARAGATPAYVRLHVPLGQLPEASGEVEAVTRFWGLDAE